MKGDGSHFNELWSGRKRFYSRDRPDVLNRFVLDAMKAGSSAEEGHLAVREYNMERAGFGKSSARRSYCVVQTIHSHIQTRKGWEEVSRTATPKKSRVEP